ncbi:hypothetical protein ABZP12_03956 [Xanthomonas euvesicatoria]
MKFLCVAALLSVSVTALAKEPTLIGEGKYMLVEQNITIFGSSDKIVAKLMQQAGKFCQAKNGKEAFLLQRDGSEAIPGTINNSGHLRQAARGATGTIYFQCGAPEPVASASDSAAKYENLAKLKALLDAGAITHGEYDAEKKKLLGN